MSRAMVEKSENWWLSFYQFRQSTLSLPTISMYFGVVCSKTHFNSLVDEDKDLADSHAVFFFWQSRDYTDFFGTVDEGIISRCEIELVILIRLAYATYTFHSQFISIADVCSTWTSSPSPKVLPCGTRRVSSPSNLNLESNIVDTKETSKMSMYHLRNFSFIANIASLKKWSPSFSPIQRTSSVKTERLGCLTDNDLCSKHRWRCWKLAISP